jgi:hypothetical protein
MESRTTRLSQRQPKRRASRQHPPSSRLGPRDNDVALGSHSIGPHEGALRRFLLEQHRGAEGIAAHAGRLDDEIQSLRVRWSARGRLTPYPQFDALCGAVLEDLRGRSKGA